MLESCTSQYAVDVRCFLLFLYFSPLGAEQFHVEPGIVKQGQVLKVYGDAQAHGALLSHHKIELFLQDGGGTLGLMPVDVLAKPGLYQLEWLDNKHSAIHTQQVTIRNAHYATQNVVLSKALSELHSSVDERARFAAFLKDVSASRYWQEPLEPPIPGCITSPFGVVRLHNGKPTGEYHAGLDQRGALGSPIHAVTGGVVKIVGEFALRGGTVAIDHGQGLQSIYLHMSRFEAHEGQQVKAGDVIGYVGSTGRSTGAHLHWTLYANGEAINPLQWVHLTACASSPPPPHHSH